MKYGELLYRLPDIDAAAASKQAISILEAVLAVDAASLFYVIQPSNVLALAGLRAQSPYNEFEPNFSEGKRRLLRETLRKFGCEIMIDHSPYDKSSEHTFSIVNTQAFRRIPQEYEIVSSFWQEPIEYSNFSDFVLWSDAFHFEIVKLVEKNKLPKEWLLDWWAPHNIRFGMLLGYPGEAIASFCWDEARKAEGKESFEDTASEFPFEGLYLGTHIKYFYPKIMKGNPTIAAHEKLWIDTLTQVYQVFTKKRLSNLTGFRDECKRFEKYDARSHD